MKTTLSVRDFATIINLLEKEMGKIKVSTHHVLEIDREKSDGMYMKFRDVPYAELEEALKLNDTYQNLKRLCDALGELQVEVQTPDVEIKDKP